MSTTDQRPTPSEQREPEAPKRKIDLSFTQVAGGALAAMTAAFLGSRLSLAGTVAGAAVASIVAAVASNLYTASLRTTQEKVRTVFRGRVADSGVPVTVESTDDTFSWSTAQPPAARTTTPPPVQRQLRWQSIVVGALAVFAMAAALLTGLELASGHSLSGGSGTTVSQVADPKPAADPSSKPTSTATASPTSSATDSPEPTASASSEPSATPSATEPTPSATATASATPSSTASASSTATPDAEGRDQPSSPDPGTVGTG
jgi:hypothetical protein